MKKMTCLTVVVVAGMCVGGCGRVAGEAYELAMGGKGTHVPLVAVAPNKEARPLGSYARFELGEVTDEFGGKVPAGFWGLLREKFTEELGKSGLPNVPGGKTLLVRGKVYHYESAGLFGAIVGPVEEVVARMELVDKSSGKVIGVANCVGRTKKASGRGVETKAQGLARAIVGWIKQRYPKVD